MGVTHDTMGRVIINFGTQVAWIGLYPEQAIELAKTILKHAGASKVEITIGKSVEMEAKEAEE